MIQILQQKPMLIFIYPSICFYQNRIDRIQFVFSMKIFSRQNWSELCFDSQFVETIDEWSSNDEHNSETLSDDEETSINRTADDENNNNNNNNNDDDEDDDDEIKHSTPLTHFVSGSLYKPHKCRRCFYRSNWKTDMLHHIRLKHQLSQANKSDYVSMDFHSALQTFSVYEKTFGKVLKSKISTFLLSWQIWHISFVF